MPAFLKLTLLK